jgi:hypothetical protein
MLPDPLVGSFINLERFAAVGRPRSVIVGPGDPKSRFPEFAARDQHPRLMPRKFDASVDLDHGLGHRFPQLLDVPSKLA